MPEIHLLHETATSRKRVQQWFKELEVDGSLAFQDYHLHKKEEGRLTVTINRKCMHTGRYFVYKSLSRSEEWRLGACMTEQGKY